ncbi:MAG: urease accessory protein UreF [Alphaproteobacteria bacterium]|jgi:urease accessory protein|nr:urease accessory protein UreF [Alphaproteobacteria bacterium]
MTDSPSRPDLLRLMAWLSPSFPTGAFSYSHGLEYAVEAGLVTDRAGLAGWLETILRRGSAHVDAVLFHHGWQAVSDGDDAGLREVMTLAAAHQATAEIAAESANQGAAFLATVRAVWPAAALDRLAALGEGGRIMLPIAVAAVCAAHRLPRAPALAAYLHAVAANLVSAGVRLIPLGQTDGQRVIAALEGPIGEAADRAAAVPLDGLGTATPMVDWTSARHETLHTRLFRS